MFLVGDENGNIYKKDYKGLKELLVDEIKEACICNRDNKEILYGLLDDLGRLATKDNLNYEEKLNEFGWYIKDIMQIYRDLHDFREYKRDKDNKPYDDITKVLDMIESEIR